MSTIIQEIIIKKRIKDLPRTAVFNPSDIFPAMTNPDEINERTEHKRFSDLINFLTGIDVAANLTALKDKTHFFADKVYFMLGLNNAGDGGFRIYYWNGGSTEPGNDNSVVVPNSVGAGVGRFIRVL